MVINRVYDFLSIFEYPWGIRGCRISSSESRPRIVGRVKYRVSYRDLIKIAKKERRNTGGVLKRFS